MYFNVNFNLFFELIIVHLLASELYVYQNALCNDKNFESSFSSIFFLVPGYLPENI